MNDTTRPSGHWAIPRRLDDPERWLFWTLDEAAAPTSPSMPCTGFCPTSCSGSGARPRAIFAGLPDEAGTMGCER